MPNMQNQKTPMPELDAKVRARNFDEVATGYSRSEARNEAARCLNCKHKPCVEGCPVGIDIPAFIKKIETGDDAEAYGILSDSNALPAVCGRVCPQENQCEAKCVRGLKGEPVAIGRLERYAADFARESASGHACITNTEGRKVAVIGSGPAGLTCAGELAKMGYRVTVFEAFHTPGGVLVYGIPEFRLPKSIVSAEIDGLKRRGVEVLCNSVIGRTLTIDDLFADGYAAVFIGSGAGLPKFMDIEGESLNGVYSANEYLTRINLMKAYLPDSDTPMPVGRRIAVVGGGNVAMDAARCAVRSGADTVYCVYRRSMAELPARAEEVHHAVCEGVVFKTLSNPIKILGDDKGVVRAMLCGEMDLGAPDASGRRSPVETDRTFELDVDMVIMALGTSPNPLITGTTEGLEVTKNGLIATDDTLMTAREGVFAGGDAVTGAATVILAMGAGKKAAASIDAWLRRNN